MHITKHERRLQQNSFEAVDGCEAVDKQ